MTENADGTGRRDLLVGDPAMGGLRADALANLPLPAPTGTVTLHADDNSMKDLYVALRWETTG